MPALCTQSTCTMYVTTTLHMKVPSRGHNKALLSGSNKYLTKKQCCLIHCTQEKQVRHIAVKFKLNYENFVEALTLSPTFTLRAKACWKCSAKNPEREHCSSSFQ